MTVRPTVPGRLPSNWSRQTDATEAIRFRRNFGKAAALSAGFAACRCDIVITMDADLQDDPKEIPRFLAKLEDGFDVVSGWKRVRHDPWHKVLPSRVFNALVSRLTKVNCMITTAVSRRIAERSLTR